MDRCFSDDALPFFSDEARETRNGLTVRPSQNRTYSTDDEDTDCCVFVRKPSIRLMPASTTSRVERSSFLVIEAKKGGGASG